MKFQLSSWAIRRPIPTILLFLILTIVGLQTFKSLPINANPQVNFPIVTVTVSQPGASPSELETGVTRRIENAIAGLSGIRHITSNISDGTSTTTVEFHLEVNTDRATADVRDAVSLIRAELPQGILEPVVARLDVEGGPLFYYAIKSDTKNLTELSWFIDDVVSKTLLAVPGVQQVQRLGGASREIRIALHPQQLEAFGITAEQVNTQLTQLNVDVPSGRILTDGREQTIRTLGSAQSVEALANRHIALSNGRWVRISDLATVTDSNHEIRTKSRLDGEEVVGFSVLRTKGSSDTVVAKGVEVAISQLQQATPNITITQITTTVDYTRSSYKQAMSALIEGALLTVLVVFLFLRNWRSTLVAAIALPLSILPTFIVMSLLDYTLNSITLLALTLVIGILVDDAIVEIENIQRHVDTGKRPFQAAIDASDNIGFAVIAITFTIVAVFLPVSFIGGVIGQYFAQFGITVSAAVLASLLVARLATPLLAAYLLQPNTGSKNHTESTPGGVLTRYLHVLDWALHHRKTTFTIGAVFLVCSFALVTLLPAGFLPINDRSQSQLDITLPPGTPLAETDAKLQKIATVIRQHPEVVSIFSMTGGSDNNDTAQGTLLIKLVPPNARDLNQKQIEEAIHNDLKSFADARFAFRAESGARDISLILVSTDPEQLSQAAHVLENQMRGISYITNTLVNEPLSRPELWINPRFDEAARAGISPYTIGTTLRIATVADIDTNSARFNFAQQQVPIRVMLDEEARHNINVLRHLRIPTDTSEDSIPLQTVADIHFAQGPSRIDRFDRLRKISIDADLLPGATLGEALDSIEALPALQHLPKGVVRVTYGDAEYMDEMFDKFSSAMGFGILMVFAVLVLLFKSFLQPITILTALPLSIGGAVGGLLLYGAALDLPAVIGILMLMGIVTKNSILLVEFAIEKYQSGVTRMEALIEAGKERARPIIMTTIAMTAGMMPAVFSHGADAGFRAPMAVAVIGGLITSTLLSLIFVPVIFSYMDDLRLWLTPKLSRLSSVTDQDRRDADTH